MNIGRQAAGNANVTGIWFWGGGRLSDAVGLPAVLVSAAPGRVGDFARGIAQHGGGIVHAFDGADTPSRVLGRARTLADGREPRVVVVAESVVDDGAAATLDAQWLAPALELLKRQRIGRLSLIADGNGAAARWSATPPTLWRRVTASARRRPFAAPASS